MSEKYFDNNVGIILLHFNSGLICKVDTFFSTKKLSQQQHDKRFVQCIKGR